MVCDAACICKRRLFRTSILPDSAGPLFQRMPWWQSILDITFSQRERKLQREHVVHLLVLANQAPFSVPVYSNMKVQLEKPALS